MVLGLFVVALSAWLSASGSTPATSQPLLALLPFVTWAATGEVVEDAEMFGAALAPYFVSPGIHFQAATWVVLAGAAGMALDRAEGGNGPNGRDLEALGLGHDTHAVRMIYASSISGNVGDQLDTWPMMAGLLLALAFVWNSSQVSGMFSNVQTMVYLNGVGGTLIFFGALCVFAIDEPPSQDRLWPLVVVLVAPALVCYWMHDYGKDAVRELSEQGLVAGALAPGMTDEEYRTTTFPEKEVIEPLRLRAVMAQPLVYLAVAGQVMDDSGHLIGIDGFPGLGEKHVVSQRVIDAGMWVNGKLGIAHPMLDEGVWLFAIVKFLLGGLGYSTCSTRSTSKRREQHLRLLIGLAMLVVGMGSA